MATHWLREITTTATGVNNTGFPFGCKVLALYLRYVLGYSNPTQDVDSIGVGDTVSVPNPTVGPDLDKQTLSDTDGRFRTADVGKTITISGMTNPTNNGVFTITNVDGAGTIRYVNAAGVSETSAFDWVITIADEDYWTTEKTGTNGSINISGSDKNFRDTTASSFVVGDDGKWLLLVDATNPRNSGIYKATYVSASTMTLDFRSGAAEYPTQNLGDNLSWWLLSDSYQVPTRRDAWFRLQTPHVDGWEIEVSLVGDASFRDGLKVRLATDGSWGGSKIVGPVYAGVDSTDAPWFYCAANTEGEFVNLFFHNPTGDQYGGFIAANLDLFDADRVAAESVALMGNSDSNSAYWSNQNTYEKTPSATNVSQGTIWSDRPPDTVQTCRMMEMSWRNSNEGFTQWASAEDNARISATQFLEGQPVIVDPNNAEPIGEYELVGSLKGVWGVHYGTGGERTAHTDPNGTGTLNRFHIRNGLGIEWPGVTEQH
jgi:hypothetical protein